jgi:beta-N-acetylhexosaminidase
MKYRSGYLLLLVLIHFGITNSGFSQHSPPFSGYPQQWVDSLMSSMTLKEKVGQLFMVAAYSNRDSVHVNEIKKLVNDHNIGGLIFFQGGPVRQAKLTNEYQELARIPLLIAMDAEWGVGMRLDSTIRYPYQMALGAIRENKMIYDMGADIAAQFKRLGMHVNFAPVVDVNNNARNPVINFRSFGEDRENVTTKGLAYMNGMQDSGILACAKHFPGHGDTDVDSHQDLPVINHSVERLNEIELYPFRKLIREGLGSIMVAHLNIPALDPAPRQASTLSHPIVTGLLKDSLGFGGIVFTDALNMEGVAKYFKPGEVDLNAFLAGNDVLLYSLDVTRGIDLILNAVKQGRIDVATIDSSVRKILQLKLWAGLNRQKPVDLKNLTEDLNKPQYQVLQRKLVAGSFTLLKNENNRIPLERLDTLRIASVTLGENLRSIFHERLDDYTFVEHIFLTEKDN